MDIPQPPQDQQMRNIIDKLAEFVARNGPEFEQMTMAKQQGNPKFGFLYGGDYYNYYCYRREEERKRMQYASQVGGVPPQPNMQQSPFNPNIWQQPQQTTPQIPVTNQPNPNQPQIDQIILQQTTLRDQIRQSELNLKAQHTVLTTQQQKQIDEAVRKAQNDTLARLAQEQNIDVDEFDKILQPIIESCTKDSISNGKSWILQHTSDVSKCHVVSQYLLKKAMGDGAQFPLKLHLIYLLNDVIHHCVRKNCDDLKKCLEIVVIPMFCSAQLCANDVQQTKLTKLLTLWESKANFFDACVISKLRSPPSSLQEYQTSLVNQHQAACQPFIQNSKTTFENYQQQHQAFVDHATRQIAVLEGQKQQLQSEGLQKLRQQQNQLPPLLPELSQPRQSFNQTPGFNQPPGFNQSPAFNKGPPFNQPLNQVAVIQQQQTQQQLSNIIQVLKSQMGNAANGGANALQVPLGHSNSNSGDEGRDSASERGGGIDQQGRRERKSRFSDLKRDEAPHIGWEKEDESQGSGGAGGNSAKEDFGHDELSPIGQQQENDYTLPPPNIPDMSRPPPGFDGEQEQQQQQSQQQPLEDLMPELPYFELPAGVMVPLIRLEDYNYKPIDPKLIRIPAPTPPSDRLVQAIEAFYTLPSHERPRDGEGWEKLGLYEYFKVKNAARKQKEDEIMQGLREKSRSPTPIDSALLKPQRKKNKRMYRSKSRSRSRSRSRSPVRNRPRSVSPQSRSRSPRRPNRGRRSRSRSRSPNSPPPPRRERRERERSISPPSFAGAAFTKSASEFIEESNRGHQMLMKMGWQGAGKGLGSSQQGINTPVSGGDVRERQDQYKGVGASGSDLYESFRRNKSNSFITRIRSRDERP